VTRCSIVLFLIGKEKRSLWMHMKSNGMFIGVLRTKGLRTFFLGDLDFKPHSRWMCFVWDGNHML
jgi:hypothetical protein